MHRPGARLRILTLFAFVSLASLSEMSSAQGITWEQDDGRIEATINWCVVAKKTNCSTDQDGKLAEQPRIDSSNQVAVQVVGFNFLHYNLEYEIDERQIEAYSYLSGLWDQILGFDLTKQLGVQGAAADWWKSVRENRELLKKAVDAYKGSSAFTKDELSKLKNARSVWLSKATELDKLRSNAYEKASTVVELQQFDIVDRDHQALIEAITTFANLSQKSLNGDRKPIGKRSAGTVVSVSAVVKPLPSTEVSGKLPASSFEYLVESTYPLIFHVGLTHTELEDAEFATVRSLDGRDLFSQVSRGKGTDTLSAYLSYPLGKKQIENARWFATLGTDFTDIGDQIYLGVSSRVRDRWFITVGAAYGKVTKGENPTEETAPDGDSSRTLFEIIEEDRDIAAFFSISVKLY